MRLFITFFLIMALISLVVVSLGIILRILQHIITVCAIPLVWLGFYDTYVKLLAFIHGISTEEVLRQAGVEPDAVEEEEK